MRGDVHKHPCSRARGVKCSSELKEGNSPRAAQSPSPAPWSISFGMSAAGTLDRSAQTWWVGLTAERALNKRLQQFYGLWVGAGDMWGKDSRWKSTGN